ncbi:minor capsid protein, partial [Geobacillus kaustophilus]|uniref:minor capsid protein n=1 Tax=Geobacillus kaustophilus TaxID=1462 RepID=UPI000A82096F
MFDIQRGLGVGFEFATMPIQTVETILKNPCSGEHFSSRIWSNTDELARQLNQVITAGFMSGIGVRKMIQEIEERFNVGKHAAARLVRTETTYMANAAEIESYKEAEIEKYIFVATLDLRTSPQC